MGELAIISSVYTFGRFLLEKGNHIRIAYKGNQDLDTRYQRLKEKVKDLYEIIQKITDRTEKENSRFPVLNTKQITFLQKLVEWDIGHAKSIMESILKKIPSVDTNIDGDAANSATGSSRNTATEIEPDNIEKDVSKHRSQKGRKVKDGLKKGKAALREGFNIDSVIDTLGKAETFVDRVIDRTSIIVVLLSNTTGEDVFIPFLDEPSVPRNAVFDFGEEATSYEAELLRKVLQLAPSQAAGGVSALGVRKRGGASHGMGGVGKTTACRAICYRPEVREAFSDGVCFLEFGQDADDEKVKLQFVRCVENFGGLSVANEMRQKNTSLLSVVDRTRGWLKGQQVLLICDDLWPIGFNVGDNRGGTDDLRYLDYVKAVLRDAPKSTLLITTRDKDIAKEMDEVVEFDSLEPRGTRAREILLAAAFGELYGPVLEDENCDEPIMNILDVCAGLPLALTIAGCGIKSRCDKFSMSKAISKFSDCVSHQKVPEWIGRIQDYPKGLYYVIEASLQECARFLEKKVTVDIWMLFQSFCVLEKQMTIPDSTLQLLWGLDEYTVEHILEKFSYCCIVKREKVQQSASVNDSDEETGVRLHDLVLVLCQEKTGEKQKEWHKKLIDSYSDKVRTVSVGTEQEEIKWWELKDDGYVHPNLTRHMAASGEWCTLRKLLCDVRWTLHRMKFGRLGALNQDFERLESCANAAEVKNMKRLYWAINRSWASICDEDNSLFPFYVFGHLGQAEREVEQTAHYLESMRKYYPKRWLQPRWKCIGPRDSREVSVMRVSFPVYGMAVCWKKRKIVLFGKTKLALWSMISQEEVWSRKYFVSTVAISADGKVVVTGSGEGRVQRWDAEKGEEIGDPLYRHGGTVHSIAVNAVGSVVVSGSADRTIRRWKDNSANQTDEPFCRLESPVRSVLLNTDKQIIVSGCFDGKVHHWNAHTGDSMGEIMGHGGIVVGLGISQDGKKVMAAGKMLRFRKLPDGNVNTISVAKVGAFGCGAYNPARELIAVGEFMGRLQVFNTEEGEFELDGHTQKMTGVDFSADGDDLISSSWDGTVRQWSMASELHDSELLRAHNSHVLGVALSKDGKTLLSMDPQGEAQLWKSETGEFIGSSFMSSSRGDLIELVAKAKQAKGECSFDVVDARRRAPILLPTENRCYTYDAKNGTCLLGFESGYAVVCDINEGKGGTAKTYDGSAVVCDINQGKGRAAQTDDGSAVVCDTNEGEEVTAQTDDDSAVVCDTNEGEEVTAQTDDGSAFVCDTNGGEEGTAQADDDSAVVCDTNDGKEGTAQTDDGAAFVCDTNGGEEGTAQTDDDSAVVCDTNDGKEGTAQTRQFCCCM